MLWHHQRWPQIEELDKRTPVIVPLGSCEQHGHHLPLFVDSIQVTAIAEGVERKLGDRVLLLPTLWLGSSHHHKDFPGTISVLPSLYTQVIKSIVSSVLNAGFRRLFFLNGHGGNRVPAAQALTELVCEDEAADDAYLAISSWWELGREAIKQGMDAPNVAHACEYETSLILALKPDLVALKEAREATMALDNDWVKTENEPAGRVTVFRRFRRLTAAGSMGKPTTATAEKGWNILQAAIDEAAAFVEDFSRWPDLPVIGPESP